MNRLLMAITLAVGLLCTLGTSQASDYGVPWNMVQQDNGYYLNMNRSGDNDGWYWERYKTCGCRYRCGCSYKWAWRKVKRVVTLPDPRAENFDEKYLQTLSKLMSWRRNDKLFSQLREFAGDDGVAPYGSAYSSYSRTIRRGNYAPNGTTYQSYSYHDNGPDLNSITQNLLRSQERAYDQVERLNAGTRDLADRALEYEKNKAVMQLAIEGLRRTPTEEVETWSKESNKSTSRETYSSGRLDPTEMARAMMVKQGALDNRNECMACHSGPEAKSGFDVTQYHLLTEEDIDDTWLTIEAHLLGHEEPRMPKDKPAWGPGRIAAYKSFVYDRASIELPD